MRGGEAAFVIATRLGSAQPSINKPIPQHARLGCIYVNLGCGTSERIINTARPSRGKEGSWLPAPTSIPWL